eukprot:10475076-Alexandrium_andersonii.AAC.1
MINSLACCRKLQEAERESCRTALDSSHQGPHLETAYRCQLSTAMAVNQAQACLIWHSHACADPTHPPFWRRKGNTVALSGRRGLEQLTARAPPCARA